jgi:two-component system LytT family response regulator
MPFRVLLVDDEPPARALAARFLAEDSRFELVGEARDGVEAIEQVGRLAPDLLVLDVQMPGCDGLDVLAALSSRSAERRPQVIFATAYSEYAAPAFDADAIDYLCKPYARARFHRALDKAARALSEPNRVFVLRTLEGLVSVAEDDLVRASAAGKHVVVSTRTGQLSLRQTLSAFEARLPPERFVRVHRSELVNLAHVERLEGSMHGDGILVLRDGSAVVLSRTCRAAFLERFQAPRRGAPF